MAFTEDLSVFFSTAGFAVEATFVPASGGAAQSAQVIFDSPTESVMSGDSFSNEYSIMYQASQMPAVRKGDRGVVDGVTYKIREVRLMDDGRIKQAILTRL
jgi:hypothetical protein